MAANEKTVESLEKLAREFTTSAAALIKAGNYKDSDSLLNAAKGMAGQVPEEKREVLMNFIALHEHVRDYAQRHNLSGADAQKKLDENMKLLGEWNRLKKSREVELAEEIERIHALLDISAYKDMDGKPAHSALLAKQAREMYETAKFRSDPDLKAADTATKEYLNMHSAVVAGLPKDRALRDKEMFDAITATKRALSLREPEFPKQLADLHRKREIESEIFPLPRFAKRAMKQERAKIEAKK